MKKYFTPDFIMLLFALAVLPPIDSGNFYDPAQIQKYQQRDFSIPLQLRKHLDRIGWIFGLDPLVPEPQDKSDDLSNQQ